MIRTACPTARKNSGACSGMPSHGRWFLAAYTIGDNAMPFQSVPQCAEAVIKATIDGKNVFNVLNFWSPGGYDQTDIDALADAVDTSWAANMLPLLHTSYEYSGTFVRGLEDIVDLESQSLGGAGAGAIGGDSFPNNVAFVITAYTGHSGRSARGRIYIGGVPASITATQNTVSGTFATNVVSAIDQVVLDALTAGWTYTIVSRVSLGAPRLVGINTKVTDIQARNLVLDSQRRRLPKGH